MKAVDFVGKRINVDSKFIGRAGREIAFQRSHDVVGARLVYLGAHINIVIVEEQAHLGLQTCLRGIEWEVLVKIAHRLRTRPGFIVQYAI